MPRLVSRWPATIPRPLLRATTLIPGGVSSPIVPAVRSSKGSHCRSNDRLLHLRDLAIFCPLSPDRRAGGSGNSPRRSEVPVVPHLSLRPLVSLNSSTICPGTHVLRRVDRSETQAESGGRDRQAVPRLCAASPSGSAVRRGGPTSPLQDPTHTGTRTVGLPGQGVVGSFPLGPGTGRLPAPGPRRDGHSARPTRRPAGVRRRRWAPAFPARDRFVRRGRSPWCVTA